MTEEKIILSSLGGSGENGRNCHFIEYKNEIILLDCGVKREIINDIVGFYPILTEEISKKIKMVFVSHSHEDHVASIPLLYELGYKGKVYATKETIAAAPELISKWMKYVKNNNGTLPYSNESVDKIHFEEIPLGESKVEGISLMTGRSGHVLGGIWYNFHIGRKNILYTGDITLDSTVLAMDIPESCDAAIMNCAYAGKQLSQEKQYKELLDTILDTLQKGGKVLLPVPTKGRSADILVYLSDKIKEYPIYVEQPVIDNLHELNKNSEWLKDSMDIELSKNITIVTDEKRRRFLIAQKDPAIYISPDGMLTTADGMEYFESIKTDEYSKIIITGHTATGTVGAAIFEEEYREAMCIKAKAKRIVFKVHLDDDDVVTLNNRVNAKTILLFHSNASNTKCLKNRLENQGITVKTLIYPETVEIPLKI